MLGMTHHRRRRRVVQATAEIWVPSRSRWAESSSKARWPPWRGSARAPDPGLRRAALGRAAGRATTRLADRGHAGHLLRRLLRQPDGLESELPGLRLGLRLTGRGRPHALPRRLGVELNRDAPRPEALGQRLHPCAAGRRDLPPLVEHRIARDAVEQHAENALEGRDQLDVV